MVGLPTIIWNIISSFLAFNDVLNLCYLHRNFRYIIHKSSFYKFYFGNVANVCSELVWKMLLKRNFEVLVKEIKHIFVYVNPATRIFMNYCEYLFFNECISSTKVQNSLSLYSIFMHFCFCKRRCNIKGRNNYCTLCSKVITQSCDDKVFLKKF